MRDPKYRWGQFLNQAKQRGLAVGISFETYQQLIYSACHYCSQYPTPGGKWPCSTGLSLSVAAVSWSCSRGAQSHMSKTKLTIPTTGNREHKGKVRLTAPRQEKKNKARPDIGSPRDLDTSCVVSAVFCLSCLFTLYTPVLESASV